MTSILKTDEIQSQNGGAVVKMQTLKHPSASGNNLELASDGNVSITNNLKLDTIQNSSGTNAISIDSSGVVSFPNTTNIGVGQTWQDVNSSRAKDTEYQNTTNAPIMVSIFFTTAFTQRGQLQVSTTSGSGFIIICDADGGDYYSSTGNVAHVANVQAIIPVNYYYKITGTGTLNITGWAELR